MLPLIILILFTEAVLAIKNDIHDKPYYKVDDDALCKKLFEEFIIEHERKYDEEGKTARFEIFKENLHEINKKNIENPHAYFDISMDADLTEAEYLSRFAGFRPDPKFWPMGALNISLSNKVQPQSFDWREKNAVTRVVNQGNCGSCWAFSAVGNIEGQYAQKHGQLLEFSKQQLVSCDNENNGCIGGFMTTAFEEVIKMGGVVLESDYPYESGQGNIPPCKLAPSKIKVKLSSFKAIDIVQIGEVGLKEVLVSTGPLSIAIDSLPLKHYKGGILSRESCSSRNVRHAVLLVGYGVDSTNGEYWIVKESRGRNFGEDGYFRMPTGMNCLGIANEYGATSYVS